MTMQAPSNVESPPHLHGLMLCSQHTYTHTQILSSAMKRRPADTCWNWALEGDTSSNPPQMQTLAKPTRFINHLRRQSQRVCVCACVCVCLACMSVNPPLLSSFRKWPLFTCHTSLPPPAQARKRSHTQTHTDTHTQRAAAVQCSKSQLFIPVVHTLPAQNWRDRFNSWEDVWNIFDNPWWKVRNEDKRPAEIVFQ